VETVDSQDVVIGTRALREFLSVEFELPSGEYAVLAEGQWFLVNRDYAARLASDLARVPEWGPDRLDLPRPFRNSPGIPGQRRHEESDEGSDQTLF
jgi:hypothetical protein